MADYKTSTFDSERMAEQVNEMMRFSLNQRRSFERRWYDNNFFDDGYHYRYLNKVTNKIVDLSEKSTLYNPMRAIPKASRQIRGVANLLVSDDPTPVVYPERVLPLRFAGNEQAYQEAIQVSKDAAKKRGYWMEQEFKAQELAEKMAFMVILAAKHGISWLEIWPDSEKEMIKSQVYDAFDIYTVGNITDPEDAPFLGKAVPRLIYQIKTDEKFDEEQREKISPDNKNASSDIKEAYMNSRFAKQANPEMAATLIQKEWFIKEYLNDINEAKIKAQDDGDKILKGKKEGDCIIRQVFVAGNITLRDRYVNLDHYPFVDFRFEPGPIYQTPLIERFIPQNKSLDAAVSRVERFMHTMNVGMWIKRSGEQFKITNDAGGQQREYEDVPPIQAQLTPMPAYVFNFMSLLSSLIEEQGVTTSTLGKLPSGVKANAAIESLKESEYANLVIAKRRLKRTLQTIAERMLEIADEYFVTPQEIEYLDKGKPEYFMVIGNEALKGRKKLKVETPEDVISIKRDLKVEVEIQGGSAFTREGKKAASKQLIDTMAQFFQLGILPPEAIKIAFEQWLTDYGFGATAEFMDAWQKAFKEGGMPQANIDQMKVGMMEVFKDMIDKGILPTPDQRIQETKVANMEALAEVQKARGMNGQQGVEAKEPSKSIAFKDLPPEGKVQLAQQAGIQIQPASMAAYEQNNKPVPKEEKDATNRP